ncbi:MAG: hypothetical protein EOO61_09165 [Hymenobacter sp.]|nr:MAG: hypothetical protein EOO61_09165 [Hymenobacter sp.]
MSILTDEQEFNTYLEVSAGMSYAVLSPSITIAERRFLRPLLGDALYLNLITAYSGAGSSAEEITEEPMRQLAKLAQEAVANLAMYLVVPRLSVQVGDTGIRRAESETQKSAYQYQQLDLQESYGNAGFDALEDMLGHLMANLSAFPNFKSSTSFLEENEFLITGGTDFSRHYFIGRSRLTYLSIRYIMKRIEFGQILPILGQKLYRKLKDDQAAGTLTDIQKDLLNNFVKPAIALLTIAKAVVERKVDVTSQGVTVSIKGFSNNVAQKNTATASDTQAMASQLTADGNDFLKRLGEELTANSALYPGYTEPASATSSFKLTNRRESGTYRV